MCEESASFDLKSFDIASCIEDVDKCLEQVIMQKENAEITDSTGVFRESCKVGCDSHVVVFGLLLAANQGCLGRITVPSKMTLNFLFALQY